MYVVWIRTLSASPRWYKWSMKLELKEAVESSALALRSGWKHVLLLPEGVTPPEMTPGERPPMIRPWMVD